jgi:hypothetical protein
MNSNTRETSKRESEMNITARFYLVHCLTRLSQLPSKCYKCGILRNGATQIHIHDIFSGITKKKNGPNNEM